MELLFIFFLTIINGVLAMSEIAVVSARKARLQQQIDIGNQSAVTALDLAEDPNRFLSTVQIGITLVGIMAGTFGGAAVADDFAAFYAEIEPLAPYSETLGLGTIVLFTTYLSLVIGELVPKRLGIQNPEGVAILIAPVMKRLSQFTYPLVWFLSRSSDVVVWLLGVRDSDDSPVTEDEINVMLAEGAEAGIFHDVEREMVRGVFRLDDVVAAAIMTPRTEMACFDLDDTQEDIRQTISKGFFSRYPVCDGAPDNVVGVVRAKDILQASLRGEDINLRQLMHPPQFIPETLTAAQLLDRLRGNHFALVLGEHGGVEGVLTLADVVETIVGDFDEVEAIQREDGSWLIDGMMSVEEFMDLLDIREMPDEDEPAYHSLGGFVLNQLGEIPDVTDGFEWGGYYFEVVDMDGKRIDKVLVRHIGEQDEPEA